MANGSILFICLFVHLFIYISIAMFRLILETVNVMAILDT